MTDADKNTETKVAAEAKSTTKTETADKPKAATKASPKVKPKAKAKSKAEKKSKAAPVDVAPYLTKPKQAASSQIEAKKGRSSAPLVLLLAAVILIPITAYKLDEQLGSQATHTEPQKNATKPEPVTQSTLTTPEESPADPEPVPVAIVQTDPVSNNTSSDQAIEIKTEIKTETATTATQETATGRDETANQRRQSYEEVMRSRQQEYQAAMEARQQQIAKMTAARYGYYQRNRQNHEENRLKIQEIQQQIAELHEKINQLRQASRVRR